MVARHGRDGISSEEGGNGAPMAKLDGFFVLRGWRDLGSSPGWVSQHVVAVQVVHDGMTEAHPSVAPQARSNVRTKSGPAQIDAVTTPLRQLGVVGARGAL
jgi:hypothetical protein